MRLRSLQAKLVVLAVAPLVLALAVTVFPAVIYL